MGMSKSGTTMIAKSLHESDIDMNPDCSGNYARCKYEDDYACDIIMAQMMVSEKLSLYLPEKIIDLKDSIKTYIQMRSMQSKNWGFKFPYLTLVYDIWKKYLPKHFAIGIKRSQEGLLYHYSKGGNRELSEENIDTIIKVQDHYNSLIDSYNIPVIQYEEYLRNGPILLENILGIKIKDVRIPGKLK